MSLFLCFLVPKIEVQDRNVDVITNSTTSAFVEISQMSIKMSYCGEWATCLSMWKEAAYKWQQKVGKGKEKQGSQKRQKQIRGTFTFLCSILFCNSFSCIWLSMKQLLAVCNCKYIAVYFSIIFQNIFKCLSKSLDCIKLLLNIGLWTDQISRKKEFWAEFAWGYICNWDLGW